MALDPEARILEPIYRLFGDNRLFPLHIVAFHAACRVGMDTVSEPAIALRTV